MNYEEMANSTGSGGSGSAANYFKLKSLDAGPARLSFFGPEVHGFECWVEENGKQRPVRCSTLAELLEKRPANGWRKDMRDGESREDAPKFFLARIAYHHGEGKFVIAQFNQKSIFKRFEALKKLDDWGPDFTSYDFVFGRKKVDNGFFEYSVDAVPQKKHKPEVLKEWARIEGECLGLAALFNGGDPFAPFDEAPKGKKDDDLPF
jgi:hypothetical protein